MVVVDDDVEGGGLKLKVRGGILGIPHVGFSAPSECLYHVISTLRIGSA